MFSSKNQEDQNSTTIETKTKHINWNLVTKIAVFSEEDLPHELHVTYGKLAAESDHKHKPAREAKNLTPKSSIALLAMQLRRERNEYLNMSELHIENVSTDLW